ncbi:mediator complex subunit [Martiniozyma asiatica (nom. inval.)]|nr:mediator complex subunit [Martiniozyma asiatica]
MTTEQRLRDPFNPLSSVQEQLAEAIETLIHLGLQVHDFTGKPEAKEGLANQVNKFVSLLKTISKRDDLNHINIPIDIIQYIEDGRNPDIYTREFVEVVRKVNQFLNGKSLGLEKFKDSLALQICTEFPELASDVELIKKTTSETI